METGKPPNILFVLADQLGAGWLPIHCHFAANSRHLTAFSRQSTVFERAITSSPICTPYRACLLSGLYPSQTGVLENGIAYPKAIPSLADKLNDSGYRTHYVGKWHLSGAPEPLDGSDKGPARSQKIMNEPGNRNQRFLNNESRWVPPEKRAGFQDFVGWESHHVDHYAGRIWEDDPDAAMEMPGHETDALTVIAQERLSTIANDDAPFFMLVSYQAPHPPCTPPKHYEEMYAEVDLLNTPNVDRAAWFRHEAWRADYDVRRFRQLYFGETSQLDAAFGRLLKRLDDLGLSENTLVVFTSDHGEMAGAHGLFGKGVMYEEALQVPLVVRAPGQVVGRRIGRPAATIDLMPTLLDYAGCGVDEGAEGISLRAAIEGEAQDADRIVISEYHNFCATSKAWKLVTRDRSLEKAALYNFVEDPYELQNRLDDEDCAEIQSILSEALANWHERVVANNDANAGSALDSQRESGPAALGAESQSHSQSSRAASG